MTSSPLRTEFEKIFGSRVSFETPLDAFLAYRIGGPAEILLRPETESDLVALQGLLKKYSVPVTVIGHGTNLLVKDGGIEGVVIFLGDSFKTIEVVEEASDSIRVRCGGSLSKPDLLAWAVDHSWAGLEFSAGVPGTIGGGIYMNAGTKYGCYADILHSVRIFDFNRGPATYRRENLYFGYREQEAVPLGAIVLWVELTLKKGVRSVLQTEVDRIIAERAEKQPLDFPSCGSTFKNPEGYSAGRLIEKSGLKGTKVGGAQISEKHANFFLNKERAKAADVLSLIDLTKKTVKDRFGVDLECEVVILGSDERKI